MSLVSIIVPVYKAEQWLHRCIDSILAQTMPDFELLLIDDGSPDRSGEICDEYVAQDPRIRVFHKENGGVSSARNLGLDNAQGEWISFIDADDWVEKEYLAGLTEKLDADFITGGLRATNGWVDYSDERFFVGREIEHFIKDHSLTCFVRAACGKLIRRKIIEDNKLRFDVKIRSGEDTIFNKKVLFYSDSVCIVNQLNYNYFIDSNISIQDKYSLSMEEVESTLTILSSVNNLLNKRFGICCDEDEYKVFFFSALSYEDIAIRGIDSYFSLCLQYYPQNTFDDFYSDEFVSPIVKGIVCLKKKIRYSPKEFKQQYFSVVKFFKDTPRYINFKHKDFYLWYFLIKTKQWYLFKILMSLYFRLKKNEFSFSINNSSSI